MKLLKSIIISISFLNHLVGEIKVDTISTKENPGWRDPYKNSCSMTAIMLFLILVKTRVLSNLRMVCGALNSVWEKAWGSHRQGWGWATNLRFPCQMGVITRSMGHQCYKMFGNEKMPIIFSFFIPTPIIYRFLLVSPLDCKSLKSKASGINCY